MSEPGTRPVWADSAVRVVTDIEGVGLRVRRLRLTAGQLDELDRYTGQREYLLGYPVQMTRAPHLRVI